MKNKLSTLAIVALLITNVFLGVNVVRAATVLFVPQGGTGASTLTDGGILLGSGTGAITAMSVLANGSIVVGDGSTDPVAITAFTSSTGLLIHERGGIELDNYLMVKDFKHVILHLSFSDTAVMTASIR